MQFIFSQGIAVLCSRAPDLAALRHLLKRHGYTITKDEEVAEWPEMQGSGITLATDFGNGAACAVDICEFPWPDDMGTTGIPTLLTSAHAMGAFGPFVHPGAFERALQSSDDQISTASVRDHRAFVRFRICGSLLNNSETSEAPPSPVSPGHEQLFLIRVAASLMEMPEALAYFNPNSELLLSSGSLDAILTGAEAHKIFPIEAVCRFRRCLTDEDWSFVDSIGMEQLGRRDHEFAWPGNEPERKEQMLFLLNLLCYEMDSGAVMAGGHTTDGTQGTLWRAEERETSCMLPPRKVLHWTLDGGPPEPARLAAGPQEAPPHEPDSGIPEEDAQVMTEMIRKLEAWQGMREMIRARAAQWLCTPAFLSTYYDDAHPPLALKVALDREMSRKKAAETWQTLQTFGVQTPQLWGQYQQLAARGQVLFAVPLMTNPSFKSTPDTLLPCAVLVATSQSNEDILASGFFVPHAYDLYVGNGDASKFPGTAKIMENDSYRLFHREIFPLQETQSIQFVLFNLMMRKSWMPPEDVPFIPVLALPGPQGAFIQIPWHVAIGGPPPVGPVQKGQWAELAELDREADKIMANQSTKKGSSCFSKLFIAFLIFCGVVKALKDMLNEHDLSPSSPAIQAPANQAPQRRTVSNVKSWAQPASVRSRATVVNGDAYQPLIGDHLQGSGFLFKIEQGFVLAASSRHQFDSPDKAPSLMSDFGQSDDLTVSLNTEQLIRQPDSQIQLVTELSAPASCLEYQSTDVLKHGDLLRLILEKGKWIEGQLLTRTNVPLNVPSVLLRMRVQTTEKIAGSSGSPIVHAETGRVVGVMLGADKAEAPTLLEFETLRVTLQVKK